MLALLDRGEQVRGGQGWSPILLVIALGLQIDQYVIFSLMYEFLYFGVCSQMRILFQSSQGTPITFT